MLLIVLFSVVTTFSSFQASFPLISPTVFGILTPNFSTKVGKILLNFWYQNQSGFEKNIEGMMLWIMPGRFNLTPNSKSLTTLTAPSKMHRIKYVTKHYQDSPCNPCGLWHCLAGTLGTSKECSSRNRLVTLLYCACTNGLSRYCRALCFFFAEHDMSSNKQTTA